MSDKQITVTITGERGTGKSTVAMIIQQALSGAGLTAKIRDEGKLPILTSPQDRQRRITGMLNFGSTVAVKVLAPEPKVEAPDPLDDAIDEAGGRFTI